MLAQVNSMTFEKMQDKFESLEDWKKETNKWVNVMTIAHAKQRTIIDKTFPALELF